MLEANPDVLDTFHPAVARWFRAEIGTPSEPQRRGWPEIKAGRSALIAAPTGSGKTLSAFLAALDALVVEGVERGLPDETRVLYVSPLKALSNDIDKNLQAPVTGIRAQLAELGLPDVEIRTAVRTGDTPAKDRTSFVKRPPHVLVTTPESLYVVLTSDSGRRALRTVRTVIVDEIHAVIGSKRGAHLALSLERLAALTETPPLRIGLSATQKPIEEVARFLCGTAGSQGSDCAIADCTPRRTLDLCLEVPGSPLEPGMAGEVWEELYDRLATLIRAHRTTLVFVSTRRSAERVSKHLQTRLGQSAVLAHHGSLAREQRLRAEQRLKNGELSALVATASLELGIDIGTVDLVCQIGTPRAIATLLQRVGRSGHFHGGTPKGIVFPLSLDELVECSAALQAVADRELDRLHIPDAPLDVLAQQIAAEVACGEISEDALFQRMIAATPYAVLPRERFDAVLQMLADGFVTARGRRGALVHRDRVHGMLRPRKGTRLTAITNGGAIPDNADYAVIEDPAGTPVGTINEDFAIESMAGDIFQLGNTSWRILRVTQGQVRVEDAKGAPPTIPSWLGEAPSRSEELSTSVSALRARVQQALERGALQGDEGGALAALRAELHAIGLQPAAADQLLEYLAQAYAALGALPTKQTLVIERFFDEAGGMQLVIHTPYGSRHNRAFGLALRKRFCRAFNFELQAAATEDSIVLSLGPTHSFPLSDLQHYLKAHSVRDLLVQALLDAPMFETRFRWNANVSLAVRRFSGGKKTPPFLQRMQTNDLAAVVFPDQQACLENIRGEREIPDHPLVQQTIEDCLHGAMDIVALERVLAGIESGAIKLHTRDLTQPSPLAHEILTARPYAFLDDAPLEERRTQAVMNRRLLDADGARGLGALDPAAIALVREQAWPSFESADEAHDALNVAVALPDAELRARAADFAQLHALQASGRACQLVLDERRSLWVAAEHLHMLRALYPQARCQPELALPPALCARELAREDAARELLRGRLDIVGPTTVEAQVQALALSSADVHAALTGLEAEGSVLQGHFTAETDALEYCERRLLSRIHRSTLERLRREIEPVSLQVLMRFLLRWQRVADDDRVSGPEGLAAVLEQLQGHCAPAKAWESDILAARCRDYEPGWLDQLSFSGRFVWTRLSEPSGAARAGSLKTAPIAIVPREALGAFLRRSAEHTPLWSSEAATVRGALDERGPRFHHELQRLTGLLPSQLDLALAELMAGGEVSSDGFAGLRALLRSRGASRSALPRSHGARLRGAASDMAHAGRFWLVHSVSEPLAPDAAIELHAHSLLLRYGVVFRRLLDRESCPPWRDLVRVYRRMEARGELRGGRFVQGMTGEQFALPDALTRLRKVRSEPPDGKLARVHAADPCNPLGTLISGAKLPAVARNRVVLRDGLPVAVLEAGEIRFLTELDPAAQWEVSLALRRPSASTAQARRPM